MSRIFSGWCVPAVGAFVAAAGILSAQTPTPGAAEAKIVRAIQGARARAGLPPLKEVTASRAELELVCTAALTGREPSYGELITYATDDLAYDSPEWESIALGKPIARPENGRSAVLLVDREWPRFSVVVLTDKSGKGRFRVGLARRTSRLGEVMDRFFAEDYGGWKKQVDPACRGFKP